MRRRLSRRLSDPRPRAHSVTPSLFSSYTSPLSSRKQKRRVGRESEGKSRKGRVGRESEGKDRKRRVGREESEAGDARLDIHFADRTDLTSDPFLTPPDHMSSHQTLSMSFIPFLSYSTFLFRPSPLYHTLHRFLHLYAYSYTLAPLYLSLHPHERGEERRAG